MDPNENLVRQLELSRTIRKLYEKKEVLSTYRAFVLAELAAELADLVEAMDDWLHTGGILPGAWMTSGRC